VPKLEAAVGGRAPTAWPNRPVRTVTILPIRGGMAEEEQGAERSGHHHFACTLSSVLVRVVRKMLGTEGVARLLERSGSRRSETYLDDITNWISYDEAMALFAAAEELTGDAQIARRVGEETIAQHAGTPVATLMRSLGSPDEIYRQITQAGSKFTTASILDALEVSPGRAVITEKAAPGFGRTVSHCEWAKGLLSQPTCLFGLPPATVQESTCQARGDDVCLYEITWDAGLAAKTADPAEHVTVLESQISSMTERLDSVYATATDLIADSDLDSVLARITERAATAVRAPRYLLALHRDEDAGVHCHHSGFGEDEALELAHRLLDSRGDELPATWLVADVSSHRRSYGRLVAMADTSFFPQERYLLELYARYAASALDGATALAEAQRGHEEASALLELARALAAATTSDQVALRLVEAVPEVVDCDRVSVWVWDEGARELSCRASSGEAEPSAYELRITPEDAPSLAAQLEDPQPVPVFFDQSSGDELVRNQLKRFGGVANISAPIVARGEFLGSLSVSVTSDADRLQPRRHLLDRLSGVVAQAATALQTARLVDTVTHQARHDALTGLANRAVFTERMEQALTAAGASGEPVGLLFVDLDDFKHVNDEWGHHAGDEVLCEVARRLLTTVRATDSVARLGGDEFAIVLAGVDDDSEVDAAAERVQRAFDEPFVVSGVLLTLGASVGRAVWPDDAAETEALMRHADAEMYRAKRAARVGAVR
jgi:diguanylate cyclase (GGDEF)-like protein